MKMGRHGPEGGRVVTNTQVSRGQAGDGASGRAGQVVRPTAAGGAVRGGDEGPTPALRAGAARCPPRPRL